MLKLRFLLAILIFPLALFAQARDSWLKTEHNGVGYAYEHLVVTRLPGGNLRYESLTHAKTDVAGMNRQDLEFRETYVVDADLRPVSFESAAKTPAKETRATGVRQGSRMNVTSRDGDGPEQKRTIEIDGAYFNAVVADLIVRRAAEKTFSLRLFGASDSQPSTAAVEILENGDGGIVAAVQGKPVLTRLRIARDGRVLEVTMPDIRGQRAYATSAQDAQNIAYLDTSGGFSLMVKSRKSFGNVFNVTRARIEARWKGIPFEEFRLEDNRQKVARKSQSGDQYEVLLDTGTPTGPPNGAAAPPREIAERYLGEDEYIKPQDGAIRRQSAEIVGRSKDHAESARKLLAWVNTNVKGDLIAETLTGPEVLAKRRGKCTEYAILFASLARAAGIPTRIALGVLYDSGGWVGHMWDEVWLGEWVAVDASQGVFAAGPSHLKFIDSATVEGTQGVRFKLVDNLQIEILDFEEGAAARSLQTGISGATYSNASYGFRISAPDHSWVLEEKSGTLTMDKEDAKFALVFFAVPTGTEAPKLLESRLAAISQMVSNYRLMSSGTTEFARHKAPSAVFSQTDKAGHTIVNENILLVDGHAGYLFAWIVPQEKYEALNGRLREILRSFEIVREDARR